jgi:hypothetical protein
LPNRDEGDGLEVKAEQAKPYVEETSYECRKFWDEKMKPSHHPEKRQMARAFEVME